MNITIYKLTDPITHKTMYVGKTTQSLNKRLAQHLSTTRVGDHKLDNPKKIEWIKSLAEVGLIPIISSLEDAVNISKLDAYLLEVKYIEVIKPSLNSDFIYPDGKISKYDYFGNLILSYTSFADLIKSESLLHYQIHNILKSIRGNRNGFNGFLYRLGDEETITPSAYLTTEGNYRLINSTAKKVYRYSKEGRYIDERDSARDFDGFNYKNISQVCKGDRSYHKGYRFSFEKLDELPPVVKKVRALVKTKAINCYDLEWNFIKSYNGFRDIADIPKVDSGSISKACRNNCTAYNRRWRYKE